MTERDPGADTARFHMSTEVNLTSAHAACDQDAILANLLAELGGDDDALNTDEDDAAGAELAHLTSSAAPLESADTLLDEIASDAEREQARQELYAGQEGTTLTDAAAPQTDAATLLAATTGKAAKPKKGAKKGGKKAAATATDPAPDTTPEPESVPEHAAPPALPPAHAASSAPPKGLRATSITHKPGDLLRIKLGDKATDFLTFHLNDANLTDEALAAKQDAFIARMNHSDAIADKVKDKISLFLLWLVNGGNLNEVLRRTLSVLHEDGELTSGDKGNLQLNLLAKPYSLGTARSQANQMFHALPELGLTRKDKGRMVPHPDSALLGMAYSMLGLA